MDQWLGRTYYLTDEIDLREFVRGMAGLFFCVLLMSKSMDHVVFLHDSLQHCTSVGCYWNFVLFICHIPQNLMYHWWEWPDPFAHVTGR